MKNLVLSFLLLVSLSGMPFAASAANVAPYGDLYLFFGGNNSRANTGGGVKLNDLDLEYSINKHSNLGFSFKYDQYAGVFELGMLDAENGLRKVWVRSAYGEYGAEVFGNRLALMIGQNWSPFVNFSHEMASYFRSEGFGALYQAPTLQLKVSYLGAYVSVMNPYVPVHSLNRQKAVVTPTSRGTPLQEFELEPVDREITTGLSLDKVRSYLPAAAVGYAYESTRWNFNVGAAFNAYAIEGTDQIAFDKTWIYSYLAYVNSKLVLGDFTLGVSGGFLVNPENFGIYSQSKGNSTYVGGAAVALENIATGNFTLRDTWAVQGYAELGYDISKDIVLFAGYGYSMVDYPIPGTKTDLAMEGYLNCSFSLGNYVALTPSISYRDYRDDMAGNAEGREIVGGILANVSFH